MKKLFFAVLLCGLLLLSCGTAVADDGEWITVNSLPNTTQGTPLFISGETSLDTGTVLNVVVRSTTLSVTGKYPEAFNGTATVFEGSKENNRWHVLVKTEDMLADEYEIIITEPQTGLEKRTYVNICELEKKIGAARDTYWITIDPVPDQMLGTTYIISGETNLPEGSKLLFEHEKEYDVYADDTRLYDTTYYLSQYGSISTMIAVQKGTTEKNVWSTTINSSEFSYTGKSFAKINSIDVPMTIGAAYNLLEPTPETPWVVIDPISDQHRGTPVIITGSVFQPQEGRLLVTIQPVWFDHNTAPDTAEPLSFVKQMQIPVPEGTTESYHWNISLDTTDLPPDMYRVEASGIDYDLATQNPTFLLFGNGKADDYTIEIIVKEKTPVVGVPFTVQGSVDTKNAATLVYELVPKGLYSSLAEIRTGYIRTTPVQAYGATDKTFWEVSIDTTGLKAGNYTLKVSALDAPVTAAAEIELPDKRTVPTSATQTPGFGFGILAIAFGTAVILGTLRRK